MALISKRHIKLVKLFLVSPLLEKILTSSYLVIFLALLLKREFFMESFEVRYREKDISEQFSNQIDQVQTQEDFINILQTYIPTKFIDPKLATFKIFGDMRIFQIRAQIPNYCFIKDITDIDAYEKTFSSECNPLVTTSNVAFSIPPPDSSLCNSPTCSEFEAETDSGFIVKSSYSKYPPTAFSFLLDRSDSTSFKEKLETIKTNGWLDEYKTKVIVFEMLLYEPRNKMMVSYQALFENFAHNVYQAKLIKNTILTYTSRSTLLLTLTILFLINGILLLLKNVFELGIQENKIVHLAEIVTAGLQIVHSITFLTNTANFERTAIGSHDIHGLATLARFYSVENLMTLMNVEKILFAVMIYTLPFKFFSFMTWSKYVQSFQKIASAIYRTLPSLVICIVFTFIMSIIWAVIFFTVLGNYNQRFESYASALLHFVFFEVSDDIMTSKYQDMVFQSLSLNLLPLYLLMSLMRYLLASYFIAVVVEAYNRSASFEFHQHTNYEMEDRLFMSEMIRKIEKFSKESLPQTENAGKSNSDRKMLVWLSLSQNDEDNSDMMDTIYNRLEENNIHLVQFYSLSEVIQFLKYLFKLKPNLLHKSANQFRIIIDNNTLTEDNDGRVGKFQSQEQTLDGDRIESLLNWLKYMGSRVPLMIYSPHSLKYEIMLKLRLKYTLLYFSKTVNNLTKFSTMQNLENITEAYERDDTVSATESFGLEDIDYSRIDE